MCRNLDFQKTKHELKYQKIEMKPKEKEGVILVSLNESFQKKDKKISGKTTT